MLTTALRVGLTLLLLASSSAIAFRGSYDDPFRWYSASAALLYVVLPTCLGFATIQWLVLTLVRLRQRRWPLAEGVVHIGIAPCSVWMSFVSVLLRCAVDAVGRIQFPDDLTVASVEHTFSVR